MSEPAVHRAPPAERGVPSAATAVAAPERRWSFRLGTFAGIDVYVHATFLLLLVWIAASHWFASHSIPATLRGVLFILSIFGCVVLHEYGHALTARRYGVKTRDIILLPIGGVARLESIPREPRQELLIAVAGPAVNVVIAAAIAAWLLATGGIAPAEGLAIGAGPLLERLLAANVFLVLFNLIPAFPMDGGRMLRALLALRLDYARATSIAASIGQGVALLFGFLGLFTNPFLLFIALFVWIGAAQEAGLVQARSALAGLPLERIMLTDFRQLGAGDPLHRAVELTLASSQRDFPVVEGQQVVGILTHTALLRALAHEGRASVVGEIMDPRFETAEAAEAADVVLARLQQGHCPIIPVTRGGRLVGLVNLENVGEFLSIKGAIEKGSAPSGVH